MRRLICYILPLLMWGSCAKETDILPPGDVTLQIAVKHHNIPIPNAVVFRKNGTFIFPGRDTSLYDTRYVTDAQGKLTLANIGNGQRDMVLYVTGIDPNWDSTQTTPVWGYQLLNLYTRPGFDSLVNVLVPVSE
ncbi:MAG: hypothetical protein IM638_17065 [Bacteroidetes bacterium]|nr:hypothetical protein [Bacteroidota bacterium]